MGHPRRRYTVEYKREAVRFLEETGRPVREVAEALKLAESVHWRGRKRVAQLMRLAGLRGKRAPRYRATTHADGTPPAPNRLGRRYQLATLNRVWASDVTACCAAQGWCYVAVVLDLASRRVIGWAA